MYNRCELDNSNFDIRSMLSVAVLWLCFADNNPLQNSEQIENNLFHSCVSLFFVVFLSQHTLWMLTLTTSLTCNPLYDGSVMFVVLQVLVLRDYSPAVALFLFQHLQPGQPHPELPPSRGVNPVSISTNYLKRIRLGIIFTYNTLEWWKRHDGYIYLLVLLHFY